MLYGSSSALYGSSSALYGSSSAFYETPSLRDKAVADDGRADDQSAVSRSRPALIDFFFLIDPFKLIYFNLPNDAQWQLLAKPIHPDVFADLVVLNPDFFVKRIRTVSETRGILSSRDGQTAIRITFPDDHRLRLVYSVRRLAGASSLRRCARGELRDFCLLESDGPTKCLNVGFGDVGRYLIVFGVVDAARADGSGREICHYLLDVDAPDFDAAPLPYNPRYEYGPGADTESFRIEAASHRRAIVRTNDGELAIEFSCAHPDDVRLRAEVTSREIAEEELRHCVVSSLSSTDDDDDGGASFRSFLRLPRAGRYLYQLVAEKADSGSSAIVCSYLIVASAASARNEPLPDGVSGYVGDVSFVRPVWIKPVTHHAPLIDCDDGGELVLEMRTTLSLDLQLRLELTDSGSAGGDLSEYAWFVHDGNKLVVEVTFPEAGQYTLTIFAKPRGQQTIMKAVWIYVINVNTPHREALPFPVIHVGWSESCELREPISGRILEATDTTFEVRIPGAKDVAVLTDSWACHSLVSSGDGWWRGSVRAGKAGSPLMLAAMLEDLHYTYLLEYQILSAQGFQKLRKRQKDALIVAKKRLEDQDKRMQTEQDRAIVRKQQTASRIANQMALFTKEKDALANREREFRQQEMDVWEKKHELLSELFLFNKTGDTDDQTVISQQILELQESKDSNLTARRTIHKGMATYLVRERLREGTRLCDYEMLKSALSAFMDTGLEEKENDLTKAKHTLQVLEAKRDLAHAMNQNDVRQIQDCIDYIRSRGLHGSLQVAVQEAERRVTELTKLDRLKLTVLGMDKHTMGEIRSYSRPPEGVHRVMQAALLLLGEDEYTTSEWSTCQKICSLVGRENLNRLILDLDIQNVNREIAARVRQILTDLDLKQVQHISAGAATFYVWALGTAEGVEKINVTSDEEEAPPAGVLRQREIFGKPALDERELNYFNSVLHQPKAEHQK